MAEGTILRSVRYLACQAKHGPGEIVVPFHDEILVPWAFGLPVHERLAGLPQCAYNALMPTGAECRVSRTRNQNCERVLKMPKAGLRR